MTKNLTSGSPTRLIFFFTLPLLIGNVFQQLYAFTDAAVVGRILGVDALAAVGATAGLTFLLIGFTWGSSSGLAIPVAKAFGAGDMVGMRRAVAAGAYISLAIAVVITGAGVFGARTMLRWLNTPSTLLEDATVFLIVTFAGSVSTVAFNYLSAVIRALGDSRTPLIFLVVACVLNAGLVVLFVHIGLGVAGAALATVVAQVFSVFLCLVLIAKRMPVLRMSRKDWRLVSAGDVSESAKIGLSMGLQVSIIAIGSLVLQYAINGLGPDAVAAFTAAMRVDQVAVAPLSSVGVALSTFVAQNRGALQWRRIRLGVFRTTFLSSGLAVVLGVVVIAFGTPIIGIFVGSEAPEVVAMAHQYLIIQGALYCILSSMFILRNTLQGMGSAAMPTMSGIMELVFRSVAGLILVEHWGFLGVCWASPLAWAGGLAPVAVAWFFLRRRLIEEEKNSAELMREIEGTCAAKVAV